MKIHYKYPRVLLSLFLFVSCFSLIRGEDKKFPLNGGDVSIHTISEQLLAEQVLNIKDNGKRIKFNVTLNKARKYLIGFSARIDYPRPSGCAVFLKMKLNYNVISQVKEKEGQDLPFRLVNKENSFHIYPDNPVWKDKVNLWNFGEGWSLLYSSDFTTQLSSEKDDYNFLLDVTDLIIDGQNDLRLDNLGSPYLQDPTIVMENLKLFVVNLSFKSKHGTTAKLNESKSINRKLNGYTITVAGGGGMQITFRGCRYDLSSYFSFPHAGPVQDHWNKLSLEDSLSSDNEKEYQLHKSVKDSILEIVIIGKYYSLRRTLTCREDRIEVADEITNLTGSVAGIMFQNRLSAQHSSNIYFNGRTVFLSALAKAPAYNPTMLICQNDNAFGIVVEDDVFRVQHFEEFKQGDVIFGSKCFGLNAGAAYTLHWSIFLRPENDYYNFINFLRNEWNVNDITIQGPGHFANHLPTMNDLSDENLKKIYSTSSVQLALLIPWINGLNKEENENSFDKLFISTVARLKKINPQIYCLSGSHPTIRLSMPGEEFDSGEYEDSFITTRNGNHYVDEQYTRLLLSKEKVSAGWKNFNNAPYFIKGKGNSLFRQHEKEIEHMFALGGQGIYMDEASLYGSLVDRTFNIWDEHTVEIDPVDCTVKTKIGLLSFLSEEAMYRLFKKVLDKKGVVFANTPPVTKKMRTLNTFRVTETGGGAYQRASDTHLYTPIVLTDDQYAKTPAALNYCIREALHKGCLTYYMCSLSMVENQNILEKMFPITPVKIFPDCIIGREKIITQKSGEYWWDDTDKENISSCLEIR